MSLPSVTEQISIGSERMCFSNGVQKDVHFVAKTLPFTMECSFPFPLVDCKFVVGLYYDSDDQVIRTPVITPNGKPLETKIFVNPNGTRVSVECRFNVLTSQHSEALFRVKVVASLASSPATSMEVTSSPIWIVS